MIRTPEADQEYRDAMGIDIEGRQLFSCDGDCKRTGLPESEMRQIAPDVWFCVKCRTCKDCPRFAFTSLCDRCGDPICMQHDSMKPYNLTYVYAPPGQFRPTHLCRECNCEMHGGSVTLPESLWSVERDFRASKDPIDKIEWWARFERIDRRMIATGREAHPPTHNDVYLDEVRAWGRAKGLLS